MQEDPSNPHACTAAEAELFAPTKAAVAETNAPTSDDDLFRQMMGETTPDAGAPAEQSDDDLFRQMMGAGSDAGAP